MLSKSTASTRRGNRISLACVGRDGRPRSPARARASSAAAAAQPAHRSPREGAQGRARVAARRARSAIECSTAPARSACTLGLASAADLSLLLRDAKARLEGARQLPQARPEPLAHARVSRGLARGGADQEAAQRRLRVREVEREGEVVDALERRGDRDVLRRAPPASRRARTRRSGRGSPGRARACRRRRRRGSAAACPWRRSGRRATCRRSPRARTTASRWPARRRDRRRGAAHGSLRHFLYHIE